MTDDKPVLTKVNDNELVDFFERGYPLQTQSPDSFFHKLAIQLKLVKPRTDINATNIAEAVEEFAQKNNLKVRAIKLEQDWWKRDQGILVSSDNTGQPVLLVPGVIYGYKKISAKNIKAENIRNATDLNQTAYMFYPCFAKEKISIKQLLLICYKVNKGNILALLGFHLLLGLLALILPLISGHIFDYIIPFADTFGLLQVSFVLIANILFSSLINLNYFIAAIRIKLVANYIVQSAVWERLVSLPLSFFMLINSGDVSNRAASVDTIQQSLTSTTISAILTGFFALFSLGIMIYLCPSLSFILFIIAMLLAITNVSVAFYQYQKLKDVFAIEGKLYGYLSQLFHNVAKIKVFNCQKPFFYNWFHPFWDMCKIRYAVENVQITLDLIRFSIMILGTMIVFAYAYKFQAFKSFGDFFIYNSLYTYFISSFLGLTASFIRVIAILPLFDRIKPILNTKPEDLTNGIILKQPKGKIELNNIYVRYENPNKYNFVDNSILSTYDSEQYISPWILKNINLSINENDFIAIVGHSGCGKTTLIKMLLGLLMPNRGTISVDNYDMQVIDKLHYRKNIGAILQSSTLFAGTILENLMEGRKINKEKIFQLASNLGVEEFINSLPMKYDTVLAEGGRNISVGQKQKLLIMKALIHDPKIIIFDEATSALDNESQIKIFAYLKQLKATRIIVSHRLTTVKEAQKIVVLDKGGVIAGGTYDEILSLGSFRELMVK